MNKKSIVLLAVVVSAGVVFGQCNPEEANASDSAIGAYSWKDDGKKKNCAACHSGKSEIKVMMKDSAYTLVLSLDKGGKKSNKTIEGEKADNKITFKNPFHEMYLDSDGKLKGEAKNKKGGKVKIELEKNASDKK
jgi:hypothetical protein